MPHPLRRLSLLSLLGAAAALGLGLAGCMSHTADTFADTVNAGEKPVAMKGQSDFFGGRVSATVTVSRGVGRGRSPAGKHRGGWQDDTSGMTDEQQMAYMRARGALGSPLPPVTLRLELRNNGQDAVQVEVQEVNSDLGNFAVQPSLLSLAPGQAASPDPMISQLGVTSDTIPVKVTLALKGKAESQSVQVRNLEAPIPAPPEPPKP